MNKINYDIIYSLNKLIKGIDIYSLLQNIINIEDRNIINLNKNLNLLNNISNFISNESMLKYDALVLLFSNYNQLQNYLNIINHDFSYNADDILILNKLVMCVNVLYENKDNKILISIIKILNMFNTIIDNKIDYIPYVKNNHISKIHMIIIQSLYENMKSEIDYIIGNIQGSIDINYLGNNNVKLNELIKGNKYIISFIEKFLYQYMVTNKYLEKNESEKYINIFHVLKEEFDKNELLYKNTFQ